MIARMPLVVLAAGGTGGHLFPAEALADALSDRGVAIELMTDERATKYGRAFPARETHVIPSATIASKSPVALARTAWFLARGSMIARRILKRAQPAAIVGFGGYPTLPPLFAATQLGIPSMIHEQNAVMGRANRLLAGRVDRVATGFASLAARADIAAKAIHTGNPVRETVRRAALTPYPESGEAFHLVVFGGSQGARVMSEVVPPALELLSEAERSRIRLVQQARDEDAERVRQHYARIGVAAEVSSFFTDMPARIAAAHLVVARSGASTVGELSVIGRPSILVPLPHALDQDQFANAKTLETVGAATVLPQSDFSPRHLATLLSERMADAEGLARAAAAARAQGIPDAASRLADAVLALAGLGTVAVPSLGEG